MLRGVTKEWDLGLDLKRGEKGLKIINCTLLTYDEAETPRLTRVGVSWIVRFRLPVKSLVLALKPVNHE